MDKIMLIIAEMNETAALHTKVSNKHLLITCLKKLAFYPTKTRPQKVTI